MTFYDFRFREWLSGLPLIGPFVRGFALPRASTSAFSYVVLWTTFGVVRSLATERGGLWFWWHDLARVLLGFAVLALLLAYSIFATGFVVFHVARRFEKSRKWPVPPAYQLSLRRSLAFVPDALFLVWAALFLAGQSYRGLNRVALLTWAAYFVAGCLIAVGRGWGSARQAHRDARGKWYADAGR